MITEQQVWDEIWPVVGHAIQAVINEDQADLKRVLVPNSLAAEVLDVYGVPAYTFLFKTMLKRESLGLVRVVETDGGDSVYIEFAWPDPELGGNRFSGVDLVAVHLTKRDPYWLILDVNPASIDAPLSSARARMALVASQVLEGEVEPEPWLVPLALYSGVMQLQLAQTAVRDVVEEQLLAGLQTRSFGLISIVLGRRLWRDFVETAAPPIDKAAVWAAAVEYLISLQEKREVTQAAVGDHYKVALPTLLPRIKRIEKALNVKGVDERYSDLATTQIVYEDEE
ncbi:MAG: hypothetical protein H6658_15580 [Ardenticatenaceae bacterium]|nr:hypothetical protein [Ardenticatenaceae bacterium]